MQNTAEDFITKLKARGFSDAKIVELLYYMMILVADRMEDEVIDMLDEEQLKEYLKLKDPSEKQEFLTKIYQAKTNKSAEEFANKIYEDVEKKILELGEDIAKFVKDLQDSKIKK